MSTNEGSSSAPEETCHQQTTTKLPCKSEIDDIVTPEVLQAVLDGYRQNLKPISFKTAAGTKPGDHYMSVMYALEIDAEDCETGDTILVHIMLKTIPRNIFRAEMINEMQAFQKEVLFYQEVFPMIVREQQEKNVPTIQIFANWPECHATHADGSTDFVAMENLKTMGYEMGSRFKGLDFNHCAFVLRNLACFHATSFAKFGGSRLRILEHFPLLVDCMFNRDTRASQMQNAFIVHSFRAQAEALRQLPGVDNEHAASRLVRLSKSNFKDIMIHILNQDSQWAVITHGDCWVNNMMFKYENNGAKTVPTDMKLMDFQLSIASSRLVDIYYFLMTSARIDVVTYRETDLLMIYQSEFITHAQKLGVDTHKYGLTWENFLEEADEYRYYGVFIGILLAPLMGTPDENAPDMEAITGSDNEGENRKFYNDILTGQSAAKVKMLVMNQMPRCYQARDIL